MGMTITGVRGIGRFIAFQPMVNTAPIWTTVADLGSVVENAPVSIQLAATDDAGVTGYELVSGSFLPSGLTLSPTGLISGTAPAVTGDTPHSFTIRAVDALGLSTNRMFSLTVGNTPGLGLPAEYIGLSLSSGTGGTFTLDGRAMTYAQSGTVGFISTAVSGTGFNFGTQTVANFTTEGSYLGLSYNDAAHWQRAGDFSMDFFVKKNAGAPSDRNGYVLTQGSFSTNSGKRWIQSVYWDSSLPATSFYDTAGTVYSRAAGNSQGTWVHIAISRVGNALSVFSNGTRISTTYDVTGKTLLASDFPLLKMGGGSGRAEHDFLGQMWNFRLSVGKSLFPNVASFTVSNYVSPVETDGTYVIP